MQVYYTPIKVKLLKRAKLHTNVKCKSESVAYKITLIILHAVVKCLIELNSLLHGGLQKKSVHKIFRFKLQNLKFILKSY